MGPSMFLSEVAPYGLDPDAKESYLVPRLAELTAHHRTACVAYRAYTDAWRHAKDVTRVEDVPFLPVTAFKEFDLRSTDGPGLSVHSSATTGTASSRIFVDKETRKRQNQSAAKLLADFVGSERRPYVVFDVEESVRGADAMSARGAAILSAGHLASELFFVMRNVDGVLEPDLDALTAACSRIGDQPFIAYGFTYVLFQAHEWLERQGLRPQSRRWESVPPQRRLETPPVTGR